MDEKNKQINGNCCTTTTDKNILQDFKLTSEQEQFKNNINITDINNNSKSINIQGSQTSSPLTINNNNSLHSTSLPIHLGGLDNNPPKFNLTPIKNLDIQQLGEKINNFKIVDNNIVINNSNNSTTSNNSNNSGSGLIFSPLSNKNNNNSNNVTIDSSSNSSNNNNNNNIDNFEINSPNSVNSSNSNSNSSNNSEDKTDKKTRRFSLYVYQHPTDEQKELISELYGYKEHHDHTSSGYRYTHDSNTETEDSSSSDSYSEQFNNSSGSSSNNSKGPKIRQPITTSPTINTPPINNNNYDNNKLFPTTILPSTNNTTTSTTIDNDNLSQIPQSYFSTVLQNYKESNSNNNLRSSNYKIKSRNNNGEYLDDEYDENKSINQQTINPSLSSAKDWNTEFQSLVNSDKIEGYRELSKLAHDFVYTAKIYGKVIISELTLPLHLKTIKPINIGGIAGGFKYICLGILFKLALDSQGLYVGDQNAMKAAGHELKGLMSYYNCRVDGLHHPLMALIDYRGYRLVAMSLLPITSDTIVYGSSDGGITVHSENQIFNDRMVEASKILNLKGHMVGREIPKMLHSCGDIEGHIGLDGKAYLLDFARVFPPQMKIVDNSPPSHLYELIRPELVKSNSKPLSSDALTGWGKFDTSAPEHNYEVKEASFRLFLKVIPEFAHYIDNLDSSDKRELHLTQELHRVGINCRHLGLVRRFITCKGVRKLILSEIMARTMKCEIMAQFRSKMKAADTPSEEPFKEVVVSYLNKIFKFNENLNKSKSWTNDLKKSMSKKFLGTFQTKLNHNTNEIKYEDINNFKEDTIKRYIRGTAIYGDEEFYVDSVDIQYVMKRFNQLTGVGLTSRANRELLKHDDIRLVQSDVKRMKAKVKAHHLVEFAEGMVLWDEAKQEKSRENIEGPFCPCPMDLTKPVQGQTDRITDRLMGLADDHFRSALAVSPHSGEVGSQWAMMLVERARMARECVPSDADTYYSAAEEKLRTSVFDGGKPKITLENVLLEYSEFLCIWGTRCHLELDMNEANGLRSTLFKRASKKLIECIKINPRKFSMVLSKAKVLEKGFHSVEGFKEKAAYYAGVATICNCLIQTFETIPESFHDEIAMSIVNNLSVGHHVEQDLKENPDAEPVSSINPYPHYDYFSIPNDVSKRMGEAEARKIALENPSEIIRVEMGCLYLRYGYASHLFGIDCSKRSHTKMASIKLLKKSGSLMQKGIDLDPLNRDFIVDHIKKFTSSSQFVDFYQSAIGCPSILDFLEDRLLRLAHMSLKDCDHLPIEFIEGLIEYSPRVKLLVLDGLSQITDTTIDLIVKKLPYLETLSLVGCTNITTIISPALLKEHIKEVNSSGGNHDNCNSCGSPSLLSSNTISGSFEFGNNKSPTFSERTSHCFIKEKSKELVGSIHNSIKLKHNSLDSNSLSNSLVSSFNNILSSTSLIPTSAETSLKPLTFLQTLNLNDCKSISDEKLIAVAQMQLPLVNLYLKNCNISDLSIVQLTKDTTKLAIIELAGTRITDQSINAIAGSCPQLKEIYLDKCTNVTSKSIDLLLRTIRNLRVISLTDCIMAANDNTLRLIGKYSTEIQCIYLSRITLISDQGICSMVKHTPLLNELDITGCVNLSDISINQISLCCPKLRILKMVGLNHVTSLKSIGNSLSELVHLDISECHKISSDLGSITKGCTKLTVFRLRRCYGFQDVSLLSEDGEIHQLQRLNYLDCSYGNIEFQAIHSISHSCKSLTKLNISYCKALNDNAIERIANSLTSLKKLKLDGIIGITDEGMKSLSEGNIYHQLEVLSIIACRKISDVSAHHILRFNTLRKLSVGACMMTTSGVDLIASNSFELVKICIRPCLNINPTVLVEKYPHIKLVQLKDYLSE